MTILTSLLVSSSSGDKIGQERFFSDRGYLITDGDNAQWLRSGTMASTATYTAAALLDHMKAIGNLSTNATTITAKDAATDGAGRWVIAYGDATNLLYSTDGVTWATVAHNAGGAVDSVCYSSTLGLWICSGNTAGTLFITSSQAQASVGSAWTARTGTATVSGTAGVTRIRASGSVVVMVTPTNGTGSTVGASRSTNGTSWTASGAFGSNGLGSNTSARIATDGSGIWVVVGSASANGQRSTDGGVTWANQTIFSGVFGLAFGNGAFVASSSSSTATSTNGAAWINRGITIPLSPVNNNNGLTFDGVNFVVPVAPGSGLSCVLAYSSDGINFKTRQLAVSFSQTSGLIYAGDGTKCIFAIAVSGTTIGYSANFNTADYVGVSNKTSAAPSPTDGQPVSYSRIL